MRVIRRESHLLIVPRGSIETRQVMVEGSYILIEVKQNGRNNELTNIRIKNRFGKVVVEHQLDSDIEFEAYWKYGIKLPDTFEMWPFFIIEVETPDDSAFDSNITLEITQGDEY